MKKRKRDKKKRKKLFILLLLLVLLCPITYRYKDGGTVSYKAILYSTLSTTGWKRMSHILQLRSF